MEWFSSDNRSYDFNMFSLSHFVILTIFMLIVVVIFLNRKKLNGENWRKGEVGMAISLILFEIRNHGWMYVNGTWKLGRSIPLELCNINSYYVSFY